MNQELNPQEHEGVGRRVFEVKRLSLGECSVGLKRMGNLSVI